VCILLVSLTYVYHDARFRECKAYFFNLLLTLSVTVPSIQDQNRMRFHVILQNKMHIIDIVIASSSQPEISLTILTA